MIKFLLNIKLVKLYGKFYAVRKGFIFHRYLRLESSRIIWRKKSSEYFDQCLTYSIRHAEEAYREITKGDEVVK